MIEEIGASTGVSTCAGREPATVVRRSVTVWRARWMSVPHSNSTHTTEVPTAVAERTRRTFKAPFTAVSIGKVTRVSISSGAIPWPSTMMVTVGAERSGKTSIGMRSAVIAPTTSRSSARPKTAARDRTDQRMMLLIMGE